MPKTRPPYPAEFRRQMIELVRAGRDPADLARESGLPDNRHERVGFAGEDRVHVGLDARQQLAARRHTVLDHFVESRAKLPPRQRSLHRRP